MEKEIFDSLTSRVPYEAPEAFVYTVSPEKGFDGSFSTEPVIGDDPYDPGWD